MIADSTLTAVPLRHKRVFARTASALRPVRRFVTACLEDHPAVDDIVLAADELASNAVMYGRASNFTVMLNITPGIDVTLWVDDRGPAAATDTQQRPADERGRGRHIVTALALASGDETTPTGHRAWADFGWSAPHPAQDQPPPAPTAGQLPGEVGTA